MEALWKGIPNKSQILFFGISILLWGVHNLITIPFKNIAIIVLTKLQQSKTEMCTFVRKSLGVYNTKIRSIVNGSVWPFVLHSCAAGIFCAYSDLKGVHACSLDLT